MEGFALGLALKQRRNATRKSTIKNLKTTELLSINNVLPVARCPFTGFNCL